MIKLISESSWITMSHHHESLLWVIVIFQSGSNKVLNPKLHIAYDKVHQRIIMIHHESPWVTIMSHHHVSLTRVLVIFQSGSNKVLTPKLHIAYDKVHQRVIMNLLIEEEGCYNCTAYYCDKPLKNNTFTLLVLTGESLLCRGPLWGLRI